MALITLESVSKVFHTLPVLDAISCQVETGEVVSVVGPSGCGKSTLLRLMAGMVQPEAGQITRRYHQAGFVFQEPRLLPWRTALDNVSLVLRNRGLDERQQAERSRHLLSQVGLVGFESYYPAQLSGGMRQRVGIARALAVDPDFVLLDEPFAALDFPLRLRMLGLLRQLLADGNRTAVYVTHDVREALLLGDRLIVLSPRPAHVQETFDLRGLTHQGWQLTAEQQAIETQVLELLIDSA